MSIHGVPSAPGMGEEDDGDVDVWDATDAADAAAEIEELERVRVVIPMCA